MIKLKLLLKENNEHFSIKKTRDKIRISYQLDNYKSKNKWFEEDGEFGFIELSPAKELNNEYLEIEDVELEKEFIGKGYGKKLYQKALEIAKKNGYKGIASDEYKRSKDAHGIWKKLSVKKVGDYNIMELLEQDEK